MNILDQPAVPQAEKCVPAVAQAAQTAAVLVRPQDSIVQFNVVPLAVLYFLIHNVKQRRIQTAAGRAAP